MWIAQSLQHVWNETLICWLLKRRKSSFGLHSASDDSDTETLSPPVLRRGRRPAIFDSKASTIDCTLYSSVLVHNTRYLKQAYSAVLSSPLLCYIYTCNILTLDHDLVVCMQYKCICMFTFDSGARYTTVRELWLIDWLNSLTSVWFFSVPRKSKWSFKFRVHILAFWESPSWLTSEWFCLSI